MKMVKVNPIKMEGLNPTYHSKSDIYLFNGDIVKIFKNPKDALQAQDVVESLSRISHPNIVTPKYGVSTYRNNQFCGYGMEYVKGYDDLVKLIENPNIPLSKRKEIAYELCSIFRYLSSNGVAHIDIHSCNILHKDDDFKFIDLDFSSIKDLTDEKSFNESLIYANNSMSQLCYQLLLGKDINFYNNVDSSIKKVLYSLSNDKQKEFLKHAIYDKLTYFDIEEYIDSFDEDTLEASRMILGGRK